MKYLTKNVFIFIILSVIAPGLAYAFSIDSQEQVKLASVGPRPLALIHSMKDTPLKQQLLSCQNQTMVPHPFSIGHRGAPLQFPEHTKEGYLAAISMGAGTIECDVAFTKDNELVCRHSQCDLHTTTNILETALASKCSVPFTPAKGRKKANAQCCTSDITVAEFKTLKAKMDAHNPRAKSVKSYLKGTANWRTDLYSNMNTLITHQDSITLFQEAGVSMTPELKQPMISMPTQTGYTQQQYAKQLILDYINADVPMNEVWPQSFSLDDIKYWLNEFPEYATQFVYLEDRYDEPEHPNTPKLDPNDPTTWSPSMPELKAMGLQNIAPPIWVLLTTELVSSKSNEPAKLQIVPSEYAKQAKAAGLNIIAWSLERSGSLANGGGWYYQSVNNAINSDGQVYEVLDILAKEVGVKAVFSDWPATTTYYANCVLD